MQQIIWKLLQNLMTYRVHELKKCVKLCTFGNERDIVLSSVAVLPKAINGVGGHPILTEDIQS